MARSDDHDWEQADQHGITDAGEDAHRGGGAAAGTRERQRAAARSEAVPSGGTGRSEEKGAGRSPSTADAAEIPPAGRPSEHGK